MFRSILAMVAWFNLLYYASYVNFFFYSGKEKSGSGLDEIVEFKLDKGLIATELILRVLTLS